MSAEKNQAVRIVSANEAGNRFVPEKCINIQAEFLDDPHPLAHEVPDTFIQTGIFSSPKLRVCLYGQLNGNRCWYRYPNGRLPSGPLPTKRTENGQRA